VLLQHEFYKKQRRHKNSFLFFDPRRVKITPGAILFSLESITSHTGGTNGTNQ
jgi:hypothetical protein